MELNPSWREPEVQLRKLGRLTDSETRQNEIYETLNKN